MPTLQANLHFVPGYSGRPVFNYKGEVVAVAESVLRRNNQLTWGYVIPINFFYPLLKQTEVSLPRFEVRPHALFWEGLVWEIGLDNDSFHEFTPRGFIQGPVSETYEVGATPILLSLRFWTTRAAPPSPSVIL